MKVNWFAIIVSTIVVQIFGFAWYALFGSVWAAGWGINEAPISFLAGSIATFTSGFLFTVGVAYLASWLDIKTVGKHVACGLLFVLLMIVPGVIANGIFLGGSSAAIAIDSAYLVIRQIIIGLIIGAWKGRVKKA